MKKIFEVKNISTLLCEKKEHLEKLLELTRQQQTLIDQEDLEDLLRNIEEKQKHIDAIEAIQAELGDRARTSVQDAQLAVEINRLVAEILEVDRESQQKVRDRMVFVRSQMSKISQGRRAGVGYSARGGSVSTFDSNQ